MWKTVSGCMLVLVAACGSSAGQDQDAAASGDGMRAEAFVDVYVDVLASLDYGCLFPCHDASGRGGMVLYSGNDMPELNDVNLQQAYDALVNVPAAGSEAADCVGAIRVVPTRPEDSLLYRKLISDDADVCGSPMPLGARPPVSAEHAELVRRWIASGAPR